MELRILLAAAGLAATGDISDSHGGASKRRREANMPAYLTILSTILVRMLGVLILLKALSSQQLGAGGTTLAG